MKKMSAAEAKTRFGQFLDNAQREPVLITKKDRPVGVFFSLQDLEDTVWAEEAIRADQEGYIGPQKSIELMNKYRDAAD